MNLENYFIIGFLFYLKNELMNGRLKGIFKEDSSINVLYIVIQEILKKLDDIFIFFYIVYNELEKLYINKVR